MTGILKNLQACRKFVQERIGYEVDDSQADFVLYHIVKVTDPGLYRDLVKNYSRKICMVYFSIIKYLRMVAIMVYLGFLIIKAK